MRKLILSIYMQVGVTIIGLPDLLDFSLYGYSNNIKKELVQPKSKYHS